MLGTASQARYEVEARLETATIWVSRQGHAPQMDLWGTWKTLETRSASVAEGSVVLWCSVPPRDTLCRRERALVGMWRPEPTASDLGPWLGRWALILKTEKDPETLCHDEQGTGYEH
jgi:hypothetical protein